MKISYAVTVCNEVQEIQQLLPHLSKHKREEDEVVVLFDRENGDPLIESNLKKNPTISFISSKFKGHLYVLRMLQDILMLILILRGMGCIHL